LIVTTIQINTVTIKNTIIFSNTDKFVENFSGLTIYSIIDLYSEYNQILFDPVYRNIIAIQTVKKLLRIITIL